MRCPYCGETRDRVVDSRSSKEGAATRRRRECTSCGRRFTTYEYVEQFQVSIIKKDRRREPYDRQKLLNGITNSCKKRPISSDDIELMVDHIEQKIENSAKSEIESLEVGELVMSELEQVDQISYIRFASVYREFKTTEEFVNQVSKLVK